MYNKNITIKPHNIYSNIEEKNIDSIQIFPKTIMVDEINEVGVDCYISDDINNINGLQKVMVAYLDQNIVKFKYDIIDNIKTMKNIKKIFSRELTNEEQAIVSNIINGNVILKKNKIYVENFNEVD